LALMQSPVVLEWASRLTPEALARFRTCQSPLSLLVFDSDATPWVEPLDLLSIQPAAQPEPGRIILAEAHGTLLLTRAIAKLPNGQWRARQDRVNADERIVLPLGVAISIHRTDGTLELAQPWWRFAGRLVSSLSRTPRIAAWVALLFAIGRKLAHPFTPPLFLGPPDTLIAGVREKYDQPSEIQAYSSTIAEGLDPAESEAIQSFKPGGTILDIGCGAGREAVALAVSGFKVVAIDISPSMIERARQNASAKGVEIEFYAMGADTLAFPPEVFDGVFIGWEIYGHIPGRHRRIDALRRVRQLLERDGILLFLQSWRGYTTWVSRARLVDSLRRFGRLVFRDSLSEPGDDLLRGVTASGAYLPFAFYHHFHDAQEIQLELEAGGFVASHTADGRWICRPR
jgi:ubiquinone/menaquinone biosynthesis C-methylase UbiE